MWRQQPYSTIPIPANPLAAATNKMVKASIQSLGEKAGQIDQGWCGLRTQGVVRRPEGPNQGPGGASKADPLRAINLAAQWRKGSNRAQHTSKLHPEGPVAPEAMGEGVKQGHAAVTQIGPTRQEGGCGGPAPIVVRARVLCP
ncbi:hypothetical protein KEM48_004955 [Puccinia striiformis f. sp. tritici PST-130]|nr:hypothetical protein KEM48_004955 [Puccinia striiformis f. sp. tritici PST-130]